MNVAQTNYQLQTIAEHVFHRKFASKQFSFHPEVMVVAKYYPPIPTTDFVVEPHRIFIRGIDFGMKVIENFGHLLTKVRLNDEDVSAEISIQMAKLLQKSSVSLVELELKMRTEKIWHQIQNPFKNVENVEFSFPLNVPNDVKLNEIFPNLRQLTLAELWNVASKQMDCFDHEFKHLEHLCIDSTTAWHVELIDDNIKQIIKKNPQIKSISVPHPTGESLKFISKHLPILESIEILCSIKTDSDQDIINFDSVKKARIILNSPIVPKSIIFPQLEQLELEIGNWFEFIQENQQIRKMQMKKSMDNEDISKLAKVVPNLEEISIKCDRNVEEKTIQNFIDENPQLMEIHLHSSNETLQENLKSTFGTKWFVNVKKHKHESDSIEIKIAL